MVWYRRELCGHTILNVVRAAERDGNQMVDLVHTRLMIFEAVLPVHFGFCPAIDVAPNELGVTRLAYLVRGDRQGIAWRQLWVRPDRVVGEGDTNRRCQ